MRCGSLNPNPRFQHWATLDDEFGSASRDDVDQLRRDCNRDLAGAAMAARGHLWFVRRCGHTREVPAESINTPSSASSAWRSPDMGRRLDGRPGREDELADAVKQPCCVELLNDIFGLEALRLLAAPNLAARL
jgi:hypothetical protein